MATTELRAGRRRGAGAPEVAAVEAGLEIAAASSAAH